MKFLAIIFSLFLIFLSSSAFSIGSKVVGGHDTDISEVPYHASFLRSGVPVCSGAILNENTILSTAWCFIIPELDKTGFHGEVRVGSSNRLTGGTIYYWDTLIFHPNYDEDQLTNNLAIIKLISPITFNENVAPIGLPKPGSTVLPNSLAKISGFGMYDDEEELYPDKLQSGDISIVPPSLCTEAYAQYFPVGPKHICSTGDVSPCTADEGAPLVQDGKLIGLVSFGFDCKNSKFPSIYVRISEFRDFIDTNL